MKTLAILAALAAITMTASATAAPAAHQAGGPLKQGKFCWVGTGIHGTGW
jgi:Spy/CpxP family protein refolding chaperone